MKIIGLAYLFPLIAPVASVLRGDSRHEEDRRQAHVPEGQHYLQVVAFGGCGSDVGAYSEVTTFLVDRTVPDVDVWNVTNGFATTTDDLCLVQGMVLDEIAGVESFFIGPQGFENGYFGTFYPLNTDIPEVSSQCF